jgi:hypothetical protein
MTKKEVEKERRGSERRGRERERG